MFGLPVLLAALSLVGAPGLPARCNPDLPPSREAQTHYPNTSSPADLIEFGQDVCGGLLLLAASPAERVKIGVLNPGVDLLSKEANAAIVVLVETAHAAHAYQADETNDLCRAEALLPAFIARYVAPADLATAQKWVTYYDSALNPEIYKTHPC